MNRFEWDDEKGEFAPVSGPTVTPDDYEPSDADLERDYTSPREQFERDVKQDRDR